MSESLRELQLSELLEPADLARLGGELRSLLGCPVAISDARGVTLWGEADTSASQQPLCVELEPVGYLQAHADSTKLAAAAAIINAVLRARWRYLASSSLHDAVVDADYEALQASQQQYKALAEELEQRVQAQVQTLEARQRQLYESERFAAIGQLAAGVAHEINTPLGFMRSNLNTLSRYLDLLGQIKDQQSRIAAFWQENDIDYVLRDCQEILAENSVGMERVERIVQDLRGFSCVDAPEMEFVDPGLCLSRAVSMLNMQKSAVVTIESDIAALSPIACQTGLLSQAFLNILRNALQAVEYGGKIRITARMDSNAALISIQDDGPGIDPECLKHVFEPFFTTRPVGSGTGLGLTVARDAIEAHAGHIDIVSPPGLGTTANIRFPA